MEINRSQTATILQLWDDMDLSIRQISRKTGVGHLGIREVISKYRGGNDVYRQWCVEMKAGSRELREALKAEGRGYHE